MVFAVLALFASCPVMHHANIPLGCGIQFSDHFSLTSDDCLVLSSRHTTLAIINQQHPVL